jgi:calcineurin-like phosphoesterase family protein
MTTFFTSDTHFGHARIIELSKRPFYDVDHMNSEIVRRWNEIVMPSDTVFHLGDVALGKIDDSLPIVSRLNGYKILVNGNHDRPFMTAGHAKQSEWIDRYSEVFQQVHLGNSATVLSNGIQVLLSHFPFTGDSHDRDRFYDARPIDEGMPLIHGHTHGSEHLTISAKGTPQIHVGQDAWDYRPVSEDEIMALLP